MGMLQAAYRTYEVQAYRAGVMTELEREPLTPIAHMVQNAQIEITISDDGIFQSATPVPKEQNKTIIPATIESANRTGDNVKAHPLCDQLRYLAPYGKEKHDAYCNQLENWADSEFSHPKVRAVWRYIKGGSILQDLAISGLIPVQENGTPEKGKIEGIEYDKCMVRWRVIPAPEGVSSASWQDSSLFESYAAFYESQCNQRDQDLCLISGKQDMVCEMHPKGVISSTFGAKLISANDSSGFTYRGRFIDARQAGSVGYTASQKAHSALRWIASNHGVIIGGRTFLCWNPEGHPVPEFGLLKMSGSGNRDFISYRQELAATLFGYRQQLQPEDDVVVAALDAATTGRLSVTYYNVLKGSDFLDRLENWYTTCCWNFRTFGVQSTDIRDIAKYAFGSERENFVEADSRMLRDHVQQLFHCIIDSQPVPQDILCALVKKASYPLSYNPENRERVLTAACMIIRKYRNDRVKKEEWTLSLDKNNLDRSYLFGRLLAVAELVERSTYDKDETREPNAIRMQAVFAQRPLYAWRIIYEQLNPYFARLGPGLRAYYRKKISEIIELLPPADDPSLGKKLEDTYLLGYYLERSELTTKIKNTSKTEEKENEYIEKEN